MNAPQIGSAEQPFPTTRPAVEVTPTNPKPFALDDRRMPGFGITPTVGAVSWMSWYDPPDWRLTSMQTAHAVRPARIHEVDCVELAITEEQVDADADGGPVEWLMYARLSEQKVQWLATMCLATDKRVLCTFLDEGFDVHWGEALRRIEDRGCYAAQANGGIALRKRRHPASVAPIGCSAAGTAHAHGAKPASANHAYANVTAA